MSARCPTCGRRGATWTREKIIEAMRDWAAERGSAPSASDWQNAGYGHPSNHTVRVVFGSLAAARKAAGVRFRRKNATGDWDKRTVCDAMFRWTFMYGEPPKQSDWASPVPGWPTVAVARRLFGDWNAAVVAAGYKPRRARRTVDGYRRVAGATARKVAA